MDRRMDHRCLFSRSCRSDLTLARFVCVHMPVGARFLEPEPVDASGHGGKVLSHRTTPPKPDAEPTGRAQQTAWPDRCTASRTSGAPCGAAGDGPGADLLES